MSIRREPLDLDQSTDEILARTEAMCRSRPRFMSREAWMKQIQDRLDARS
jgi:catechol 2,3-dioxygenase